MECYSRSYEVNYQENEQNQNYNERSWSFSFPSILNRLAKCCTRYELPESFHHRNDAVMRGRELVGQKKFDKAIHAYVSALNLPPSDTPPETTAATSSEGQLGHPSRPTLECTPSEASSTDVSGASPTKPLLSYEDSAKTIFTHLGQVDRDPVVTDANIYAELGQVFFAVKRFDQAIEAFDKAQLMSPDDVTILYQKAVALNASGNYASVLELLNRAVALEPDFGQAHFLLAVANRELNRLSEATENLQTLLTLEPDRADTLTLLADCYEQQARYREAALYLERAVELEPNDHTTRRSLENVLASLQKNESPGIRRIPPETTTNIVAGTELECLSRYEQAQKQNRTDEVDASIPSEAQTRIGSMESLSTNA